jgi:cadmium resistance protein CadD (predicted permease)
MSIKNVFCILGIIFGLVKSGPSTLYDIGYSNIGFFDPVFLGFSYFNIVLIFIVIGVFGFAIIMACCCFGSKSPPVEYKDIVGKFGGETLAQFNKK